MSPTGMYALEKRAEQLFGAEHLRMIFRDSGYLLKFTGFLNAHRPQSIPLLIFFLDSLKAIRAISYANAIAEALSPIPDRSFSQARISPTRNKTLEDAAALAFDAGGRGLASIHYAHLGQNCQPKRPATDYWHNGTPSVGLERRLG